MKYLLIIQLILVFLIPAEAAVNNSDLIINGGIEEITLQEGEKYHLRIQDDLTRLPIFKDLYFQSTNPLVASVGKRNGIVRAHFVGKATIIVTAADGDNADITITVERKTTKKPIPTLFFFLLILTLAGVIFLLRQ